MSNLSDLLGRWATRDSRYSIRRVGGQEAPLTAEEAKAIRIYRRTEIDDLSDVERDLARIELDRWAAPKLVVR
jgi:hypothetical protein